MFSFTKTYNTPSIEQLDALAINVKSKSNERLNSDCAYLLNVFNQTLVESLSSTDKTYHSVDIDASKLNNYIKVTECANTQYDIISTMNNAGVKVEQRNWSSIKYTFYNKINKTLNLYL